MKPYPNFQHLERVTGITWNELVDVEPGLAALLWEARQAGAACRQWPDVDRAFVSIRNTLTELVGFTRKNCRLPILASTEAYQVAYWKLFDAVAGLLPIHADRTEAGVKTQVLAQHGVQSEARADVGSGGVTGNRRRFASAVSA
jgi:hypothetical protein